MPTAATTPFWRQTVQSVGKAQLFYNATIYALRIPTQRDKGALHQEVDVRGLTRKLPPGSSVGALSELR